MRVATTAFDALSWQLLASVFVPGSMIHFTYSVMTFAVAHVTDGGGGDGTGDLAFSTLPAATTAALNYLPTVVGLATIPFIVEPIDETIHKVRETHTHTHTHTHRERERERERKKSQLRPSQAYITTRRGGLMLPCA